ncbi:hypothetical protein ACFFX0_24075 [Citricoccus parietis]|uniref:Uncharacterized protein n=1 Tax=Citricoccus parietis TaxID=592307 RepID=A0ABV5G5E3_9MICC
MHFRLIHGRLPWPFPDRSAGGRRLPRCLPSRMTPPAPRSRASAGRGCTECGCHQAVTGYCPPGRPGRTWTFPGRSSCLHCP